MSASGVPVETTDLTDLGRLGLLACLSIGPAARGRTPGMRLLRIRLAATARAGARLGVPVRRPFFRVAVAIARGAIPSPT